MDFKVKGISWVGNVYQKFEAMCLEVEDVVCQETAKYVETQVQTVGSSVKKFYAEVLQDLLPPSSLDHKENEGSGLPLENNAAIGTYEKPKQSSKEDPGCEISCKVSETKSPAAKSLCQEKIDEVVTCQKSKVGTGMYASKERSLPIEMSEVNTEMDSVLPLEDSGNHEICKKSHTPTKTGAQVANLPLPDLLALASSAETNSSRESSFDCLLEEGHAKECDTHVDMHSPVSFDLQICDSHRKTGTSCSKAVVEFGQAVDSQSASHMCLIPPGVPCERRIVEIFSNTSNDISTESNGVIIPATIDTALLKETSWSETEQFSEGFFVRFLGFICLDPPFMQLCKCTCSLMYPAVNLLFEYAHLVKEGLPVTADKSDEDYSELEKDDDIVELASEIIEMYQNVQLEESCIVVDSTEVPSVPHQAGRSRSYKKKIRDALASRMKLPKKLEHEQLPIWHVEINSPHRKESSGSSLITNDLKKPPNGDNGDSEWELL